MVIIVTMVTVTMVTNLQNAKNNNITSTELSGKT